MYSCKTITILPDPIKIRSSITNFSANCTNNGISIIHPYGGVAPYSFLWSTIPPQNTDTAFRLGKGNYSVSITDSLGCSVIVTTSIDSDYTNKIVGTVFNDLNKNCQLDSNENPLQFNNAYIKASNGTVDYYSSIDANGNYEIKVGIGSWRLSTSLTGNNNCSLLCFDDTANFTSLCNITSKKIFYQTASGVDYEIHPGWSASRPGFDKTYWIYYSNWSANAGTPSTINFVYDSNLIYKSSNPPVFLYDSIYHTLSWDNLALVKLGNTNNYIRVEATFNVPATLPLAAQLNSSMNILPTQGDCAPENNSFVWSEEVTGSHDPNEKIANPSAEIYQEDSIIQYKINFQNTGTDTAFFIVLRDTLSEYLEPNSVNTIATSHPYIFSLKDKGALSWRFDPILLPDSNTNEKNSHGFVLYSVKRKANLPLGTEIKNTAHIYFDYNEAIVTNTTVSKMSEHISGISETTNFSKLNIQVYPNPLSDGVTFKIDGIQTDWNLRIMNVVGKEIKNIKNILGEKIFMSRGNISSGIYIYEITSGKELIGTGKIVVN